MGGVAEKVFFKSGLEKLGANKAKSLFDFTVKDIDGKPIDLSSYRGNKKAFIITNVACACGLTGEQYTELVELYTAYKDRGLLVIGFPCNQFKNQESQSEEEIKKFVKDKFNVTFPMMEKIEVNGPNTHPLYVYLRNNSELFDKSTGEAKQIPWNFGKFLVNKEGQVVKFYGPRDKPLSMKQEIEQLIQA